MSATPDQHAESVRVSFHVVPVKEGAQIRLTADETVMSVEYDAEVGRFYAIVMHAHTDGAES